MAGKFDNTSPDQDYDTYELWSDYYDDMQKEGLSDDQIASRIKGSKWDKPELNAGKWLAERANKTVTTPSPNVETQGVTPQKDPEQKYKMKSIQQAYYDGEIDKNTRDYLLVDAFSKFARNMGKDIGNIAAAYSGGTVNNDRETSQWDARNAAMLQSGINAEQNQLKGTSTEQQYRSNEASITGKELDNRVKVLQKTPAENFAKEAQALYAKANDPKISPDDREQYKMQARLVELVGAASTQNVGTEEYVATVLASSPEIQELVKKLGKTVTGGTSVLNNILGALGQENNTDEPAKASVPYETSNWGNDGILKNAGYAVADSWGDVSLTPAEHKKIGQDFRSWYDKANVKDVVKLIGSRPEFTKLSPDQVNALAKVYNNSPQGQKLFAKFSNAR